MCLRFAVSGILSAVLNAVCGFGRLKCGFMCGLQFQHLLNAVLCAVLCAVCGFRQKILFLARDLFTWVAESAPCTTL